jgi:hypothetical protein
MRLFLSVFMVVVTFAFVVLLISWLFPQGAGWAGVWIAMTCLYASVFAAWAWLGNRTERGAQAIEAEVVQTHSLRDNLLYFAVGMAVVTLVIAVARHDTENGIHRNFKNDWFVGFGSACVALAYAARAFWSFRRNWRLWSIIAALFAIFTVITVPLLSQIEKVPLLFMGPLANIELLIAMFLLDWFLGLKVD